MSIPSILASYGPCALAGALFLPLFHAGRAWGAGTEGLPISEDLPPSGSEGWPRACSLRHSFCIRAVPGTHPALQLEALASADRAWEAVTGILGAPAPEGDLGVPWPVYLVDRVEDGVSVLPYVRDPRSHFDRESSFARVDRDTAPGCPLDLAMSRAVAAGSIWRGAPAVDRGSARAQSETLARLATPCAPSGDDDLAFQAHAARCVVDPTSLSFDRGASLFFDWIDQSFGAQPGALVVGAWALAPTLTPAAAWRWAAAPTTFDVLRVSLQGALGRASVFDDVLVKFGVARASMNPRPAAAWSLPWPTLARRLAPAEPIAPTGTSYVIVDHKGAPSGAKLRVEAQWEDYARIRWVLLKRDAAGRTLAEIPMTAMERRTNASMTVEQLDGVDHILIVIQNVGSTERVFNPGQGEWEPHGWLLTVEGQGARDP